MRTTTSRGPISGTEHVGRYRRLWAFLGIVAVILLVPLDAGAKKPGKQSKEWGHYNVGHSLVHLSITDSIGAPRPLDVLLWYPAAKHSYDHSRPSIYTSRLNGVTLVPGVWDPMSWEIPAEVARNDADIVKGDRAFPFIIISHGSGLQPDGHAGLAERLASHGYIVAAPFHDGDTVDDVNQDYLNILARTTVLPCFDGHPSPCRDPVRKSVSDRVLDIKAVIDNIGVYFGNRVDLDRIALFGMSRGSVTAIAVAGGGAVWNIAPEPRIKALFMVTTGTGPVIATVNPAAVNLPFIQLTGTLDQATGIDHEAAAKTVFATASSPTKALVVFKKLDHMAWRDRVCAQAQAIGAIAQADPKAILEIRTENDTLKSALGYGGATDWCYYDTFKYPVDITGYVQAKTGIVLTPDFVPTRFPAETALAIALDLSLSFFGDFLHVDEEGDDDDEDRVIGAAFERHLGTTFLDSYGDIIETIQAYPCLGKACSDDGN